MAGYDKVRVIVVGDSGVGKSSLTHLIAHNEPISSPLWTVGAAVEVKLHEYKEGTAQQKTYFVELWDIGGSSNHRNIRSVFYNPVHGIILVHDLTNKKSQQNLKLWLTEVISKEGSNKFKTFDEFDTETIAGTSMIPMIVIGTKLDLAGEGRVSNQYAQAMGQEWGADRIFMDCRDPRSLAPGSSSSVKLSRFLDKVIEMKYHRREAHSHSVSPFATTTDKRRIFTGSPTSPKLYHND